jgi:hypothetical protein
MKKGISALIVIIIVILAIILLKGSSTPGTTPTTEQTPVVSPNEPSSSAPVSETTKVSSQLSEYSNAELGFSVKYPAAWEKAAGDAGVSFVMPIDKNQVSTVAKLQADINVISKCAFPPVTTVKDRSTLKVGSLSFPAISMSNTVQGRTYFTRMYSLQQEGICYMFAFSSITLDPTSKGLTGSNVTQAQNNNKAIVAAADTAFTDMVKSFALVTPAQGIDETKAPVKK